MSQNTAAGRHSNGLVSYLDEWARRYPKAQAKIERFRLRQGKAKHRADSRKAA